MLEAAPARVPMYRRFALTGAMLGLIAGVSQARAQADVTASRTYSLSAFAGAEGVHPEYLSSPNNVGFFVGGDVTHFYRIASPSLEVRFNDASGSTVIQRSFLVGIKGEHAFGPEQRFHPYLVGLVGEGAMHFVYPGQPQYTHDNSLVLDVGAGLDFDVTRHFQIKGDFHIQHWHLGKETSVFSPEMVSVGVVYRPTFGKLSVR